MPKPSIFVTRAIPQPALDRLGEVFDLDINPHGRPVSRQELIAGIRDKDALLCLLTDPIDRDVIDSAPSLKCISNYAVGYNNIDVDHATHKGIAVCNTPGVLTETTADLAWSLIMCCARRIQESDRYVREGRFTGWEPMLMLGSDVFGKTLGIIGMGRIGQAVARRAEGFNMKVLWFDPMADPSKVPSQYQRKDLACLCSEADIISIHAPLTAETQHLISAEQFALMKPEAVLVNTARGPIVDEQEMIKALREHRIASAGLDVYEREPDIPRELRELPNVVLLPHIGSASIETRTKMGLLAAENAIAVIEGRTPPARVN
jgi:glyoxylate reductase